MNDSVELKSRLESETDKARIVRDALLDEIEELNHKRTASRDEIEELATEADTIKSQLLTDQNRLEDTSEQVSSALETVEALSKRQDSLRGELKELEDSRWVIKEDLDVLNNEAELTENRIIELDTQYKERKAYLDKLLSDTQLKLKEASDSLTEAQNKDKTMREAWAEEHMKLEKREATVRRMEAKVSDAESRIEELGRYDRL